MARLGLVKRVRVFYRNGDETNFLYFGKGMPEELSSKGEVTLTFGAKRVKVLKSEIKYFTIDGTCIDYSGDN